MKTFKFNNKTYETDDQNFLIDHATWDENFAIGMAAELGIFGGLTERHWKIIHFIQDTFEKTGTRPLIYKTCKTMKLQSKTLRQLFPTGYLRGACLLAGIGYKGPWDKAHGFKFPEPYRERPPQKSGCIMKDKVYKIDIFGFLVDPEDWDEEYAVIRAYEMKIKNGLTPKHWEVIYFLRDSYKLNRRVPTIYDCCELSKMDVEDIEELFPDGYHRCAVKIAGLPSIGVNIKRTIL
ncbi:MAG: TusE/DsrC/DsvC family sulfur relay protein [Desulfobacteraceae bacterium]|nr:TusE/DsrC/DsvC family sulfur relay protein [Desulfobacteraceae bacterium]MBC2756105.1 TusE/DsrC/DsvC family sulfur relay protein [Desulfobacteraceae bacterium]MBC2763738.1 TusE/DsrC/DsvC family sulfur relay protein [ANME-2 cluster archaeon]